MQDLRSETASRINLDPNTEARPHKESPRESEVPVRVTPRASRQAFRVAMVSTLERHATVAELREEWDALADRAAGQPWVRPGWVDAWWRAFGAGPLEIMALRHNGELAAVLPLCRRMGALSSVTNWHTPEFDAVGEESAVAELIAKLLRRRPRRMSMAFVNADVGASFALREIAKRRGYRLIVRPLEHSPYIATDIGWTTYLAARDGKMLRELRRRRRLLEREGALSFSIERGGELLEQLVDEGFRVEAAGWKGESGSAVASDPATLSFYHQVARWASSRGALRLGFIRLDGRAIAFDFSIEEDGVHYLLKTGFDPDFSRFSPGKLLRYKMIEHTFDAGLRFYEFLGSNNPWKDEWTQLLRERSLVQAFSRSLPGLVDWSAFAFGRPLAKRVLALAGR